MWHVIISFLLWFIIVLIIRVLAWFAAGFPILYIPIYCKKAYALKGPKKTRPRASFRHKYHCEPIQRINKKWIVYL